MCAGDLQGGLLVAANSSGPLLEGEDPWATGCQARKPPRTHKQPSSSRFCGLSAEHEGLTLCTVTYGAFKEMSKGLCKKLQEERRSGGPGRPLTRAGASCR